MRSKAVRFELASEEVEEGKRVDRSVEERDWSPLGSRRWSSRVRGFSRRR